jgi:hypothetical protein
VLSFVGLTCPETERPENARSVPQQQTGPPIGSKASNRKRLAANCRRRRIAPGPGAVSSGPRRSVLRLRRGGSAARRLLYQDMRKGPCSRTRGCATPGFLNGTAPPSRARATEEGRVLADGLEGPVQGQSAGIVFWRGGGPKEKTGRRACPGGAAVSLRSERCAHKPEARARGAGLPWRALGPLCAGCRFSEALAPRSVNGLHCAGARAATAHPGGLPLALSAKAPPVPRRPPRRAAPGGACAAPRAKNAAKQNGVLGSALPIGNALPIYFGRRGHFPPNCSGTKARRSVRIELAPCATPVKCAGAPRAGEGIPMYPFRHIPQDDGSQEAGSGHAR